MTDKSSSGSSPLPPCQAELAAVSRVLLEHPVLVQAERKVREAINLPAGYDILLVVGPTGVGKTTLQHALLSPTRKLAGFPLLTECESEGALPVVSVTAHNGRTFVSRWKALLLDILKAVNPVLFDFGKYSDPFAPKPTNTGRNLEHVSIARLSSLVTDALKLRRTRAILVDESQHLAPAASRADFELMVESLKELGSAAKTVLVLFGSYTLLSFPSVSAQLSRRSSPVHFRRYLLSNAGAAAAEPEDNRDFRRVFCSFSKSAPTMLPDSLLPSLPFLYCGSMGCTGVLRDWLVRAISEAISRGLPSVTPAVLEATALPLASLKQMLAEVEFGEQQYAAQNGSLKSFMTSMFAGSLEAREVVKPALARDRLKPGTRKPTRDPVGAAA